MAAWRAGFQEANPDATVNYDPVGSGGGREQFVSGATDFGGTDAYLDEDELTAAQERCGGSVIELPNYISPIAVAFNLPGIDALNMDADTIAQVFSGEISTWDDSAIAEQNPDADLPDTTINAVHRADASGTTENFTDYLDQAAPGSWSYGVLDSWDEEGGPSGEAAQGTSGVVQAINAGEGSIGYADASQVIGLGTVAVQVGDEYVPFTPEAAAAIVDAATVVEGRDEFDLAIDLPRDTTEAGVYPIVLVSYHMACPVYDDQATADLVADFLSYIISPEGQDAAAANAGSAPISDETRAKHQEAVDSITAG